MGQSLLYLYSNLHFYPFPSFFTLAYPIGIDQHGKILLSAAFYIILKASFQILDNVWLEKGQQLSVKKREGGHFK